MKKSLKYIITCIIIFSLTLLSSFICFANSDGWTQKTVDGKSGWYYYENGEMKVLSFVTDKETGDVYYLDENGMMVTGWGTGYAQGYYFDEDGVMVTGWQELTVTKKVTYPASGNAVQQDSGMLESPSRAIVDVLDEEADIICYFKPNGMLATGWEKIDGNWYYFADNKLKEYALGEMLVGKVGIDNGVYYFGDDGRMQTGLIELDEDIYYFSATGKMLTSKTIYQVKGKWTTIKPTASGKYNSYVLSSTGKGTYMLFTVE